MNGNPFADAQLVAMGGQMLQAYQKLLESWWQGVLADPARVADLARKVADAIPGIGGRGAAAASAKDLSSLLQAIELLEQRTTALEEQVRAVAEGLATVAEVLERQGAPTPSAGAPRGDYR